MYNPRTRKGECMSKYETVYRVVKNKDSNDFNNELEFTIEPYYINKENTKIQRKGFDSWNDITAEVFDSIYWNRKSAEKALVSYISGKENQKAIEFLEDVRDSILDISNGWWKCFKDGNQYMTSTDLQGCLKEIIDQKISELNGE